MVQGLVHQRGDWIPTTALFLGDEHQQKLFPTDSLPTTKRSTLSFHAFRGQSCADWQRLQQRGACLHPRMKKGCACFLCLFNSIVVARAVLQKWFEGMARRTHGRFDTVVGLSLSRLRTTRGYTTKSHDKSVSENISGVHRKQRAVFSGTIRSHNYGSSPVTRCRSKRSEKTAFRLRSSSPTMVSSNPTIFLASLACSHSV